VNDTSNHATAPQTLDERYGRGRSPGWLPYILVGALAAVLLAWLVWAAWQHATPDVRGELRGYEVVSDHEISVKIDVVRSGGAAVACTVRALAEDHSVVGEDVVTLAAGEAGSLGIEASIETDRRATAATVTDCA